MPLLVSSRNAGNVKLVWFQVYSDLQRKNHSKSKVSTLKVPPGPKTSKRMVYKNEKRMLHALDAFARFCKTLYRRRPKSCSNEFVWTLVQGWSTCSQERRGTNDFKLHHGTLKTAKKQRKTSK